MNDFITSFVRIIPKKGHEEWIDKLYKMELLCYEAEYQMVKQGHRLAATTHVHQHNLKVMLERFNKDGLIFTPLRKSGFYVGFGHKHKLNIEPGEEFYWYGCLTRTYKDAQKFKKADIGTNNSMYDHKTIGLMLGFPECCAEYFTKTYLINYDPIWLGREGKIQGYPECNQMLRYFGAKITSHFSCSPTCKKTKEMGEKWFKVMKEINRNLAEEMYDLLAGPIIWDSYHGVAQVETPYFVGLTHTFPFIEKKKVIEWKGKN